MAQQDTNVIDQPEVLRHKMVTIEISGKKYEVPEGITVITHESNKDFYEKAWARPRTVEDTAPTSNKPK